MIVLYAFNFDVC